MSPEIKYKGKKKKPSKNTNTWRLKNMLLNNQWITENIKEEIKKKKKNMRQVKVETL